MTDPKQISAEDAITEGVYGTLHDTIENDAYTVQGQGPETAKREREQIAELRQGARERSSEGDTPAKSSKTSKSSSATSSSSSS
jgi:hypothetical protein